MDMEYWSHQQVVDFNRPTTAVTTTAEESLIPTLRKEVNSSIVTSAGQTVYLHCLVENLGERSVSIVSNLTQFDIIRHNSTQFDTIRHNSTQFDTFRDFILVFNGVKYSQRGLFEFTLWNMYTSELLCSIFHKEFAHHVNLTC